MSYAAWSTAGLQLSLNISSTLTNIAGVESLTITPGSKPQIDTTPINSNVATSVVGISPPATASASLFWDPGDTGHARLLASHGTTPAPLEKWQINCTDAGSAVITFNGYIQQFGPLQFEKNGASKASITIAIDGAITVTP